MDKVNILGVNIDKCNVETAADRIIKMIEDGDKCNYVFTPNSEILIHQPLIGGQGGGISGQTTEIKIQADQMVKTRERINKIISSTTGKPIEEVEKDTERDHYLTAQEALEYGLIDGIMDKRK